MNLLDTDIAAEFYRRWAVEWRARREKARLAGDFEAYDWARKECNNYARGLPESERAEFWED